MKTATEKNGNLVKLMPIMFGFFVMGFVDVVGIATNYIKVDFALTETISGLLPLMVFLWFAVCSVPTSLVMNKIGRKNTVLISMLITVAAMLIPIIAYDFTACLIAFALMGIGNTILQVSLNPLISNIASGKQLTSSLTLGQFVKAIASFVGPILATFAASQLGDWKLIFPVYAAVTIISTLWLAATPIQKEKASKSGASFGQILALLKDPYILILFFGILFLVGADVSINISTPKILMDRCALPIDQAGLGTSLYFAARTIGAFIGAILLAKYSAKKMFTISMFAALLGYIALMLLSSQEVMVYVFTAIVGFALANIFSIIFSFALQHKRDKANEISGLMIMGVSGGAIFPFIMGVVNDAAGVVAAMGVVAICILYILFVSLYVSKKA